MIAPNIYSRHFQSTSDYALISVYEPSICFLNDDGVRKYSSFVENNVSTPEGTYKRKRYMALYDFFKPTAFNEDYNTTNYFYMYLYYII